MPTLKDLRYSAARSERDLWVGTLSAAADSAATTLSSRRPEAEHYFRNFHMQLDVGVNREFLRVLDSVGNSLTLPTGNGCQLPHLINTEYSLHRMASADEYHQWIRDAIEEIADDGVTASLDDQTLTVTAAGTKPGGIEDEYTVPAGFRFIYQVWVADAAGNFSIRIPNEQIYALPGSTHKIRFSPGATTRYMTVGRSLRLLGQGRFAADNLTDTTEIGVSTHYINNFVRLRLLETVMNSQGPRADSARSRYRSQQTNVLIARTQATTQSRVLPGSIIIPN